jgi:virulence-associated protein VagC
VTVLREGARRVIVPSNAAWKDVFDAPGVDIAGRDQLSPMRAIRFDAALHARRQPVHPGAAGSTPTLEGAVQPRGRRPLRIDDRPLANCCTAPRRRRGPEYNRHAVENVAPPLAVLAFDADAAGHAAQIRARLQRRGQMIGGYDVLIAGHARRRSPSWLRAILASSPWSMAKGPKNGLRAKPMRDHQPQASPWSCRVSQALSGAK